MPDEFKVRVPRGTNQLNVRATMFAIRTQLQADPAIRDVFKKDPIGVLIRFGIPRTIATAIVADDLGVAVRTVGPDVDAASDVTSCCCSACSVSHLLENLDPTVFPAVDDIAGWQKLSKARGSPQVMSPAEIEAIANTLRHR